MEKEFVIKDFISMIKMRKKFILYFVTTCTLLMAIWSFFLITPVYEASSQFILRQESIEGEQVSIDDFEVKTGLINTYTEILKSPLILDKVIDALDLDVHSNKLASQIEVIHSADSHVITVRVQANKAEDAVTITNTLLQAFKQTVPTIIGIDNVFILSEANFPDDPIKPKPIMNISIALVVSLVISVAIVIGRAFFSTKIVFEEDIEELVGIPVIGSVTYKEPKKQLLKLENIKTLFSFKRK
jgi:capsular polysaccharide biosynthesis protein